MSGFRNGKHEAQGGGQNPSRNQAIPSEPLHPLFRIASPDNKLDKPGSPNDMLPLPHTWLTDSPLDHCADLKNSTGMFFVPLKYALNGLTGNLLGHLIVPHMASTPVCLLDAFENAYPQQKLTCRQLSIAEVSDPVCDEDFKEVSIKFQHGHSMGTLQKRSIGQEGSQQQ